MFKRSKTKEKTTGKYDPMELSMIKRETRDFHIAQSWHTDPLGPLNYEEKEKLRNLRMQEKERLRKVAEARHTYDPTRRQPMMTEE
jgi:hypothetical protein